MKIIKTFAALSGLSSIHRFSMMKLGNPESVLEHIGFVTMMANLLARELNVIEPGTVDVSVMTLKCLVHDLDELVIGDIPRPTKYHTPAVRDEFKRIELWGVTKIVGDLSLSRELQDDIVGSHQSSKAGTCGLLVETSDVLAVAYKVWEEVIIRGNASLIRQSKSVIEIIPGLLDKISTTFPNPEQRNFLHGVLEEVYSAMTMAVDQDHPMKEIMVP